mgnify:CR=1 FL=1
MTKFAPSLGQESFASMPFRNLCFISRITLGSKAQEGGAKHADDSQMQGLKKWVRDHGLDWGNALVFTGMQRRMGMRHDISFSNPTG